MTNSTQMTESTYYTNICLDQWKHNIYDGMIQ